MDALISIEEYLNTSYDPEVEYVDGVLVGRNAGEWFHGLVQSNVAYHLRRKYPDVFVVTGLCSQTRITRYRIPDVCVVQAAPHTEFLSHAPFLAVEVLSEDDRMTSMIGKFEEYQQKGIAILWLIDPRLKKIFVYRSNAFQEVPDVIATEDPRLKLTREEVFQY